MSNVKKKEVFTCFEEAFTADLDESPLNRQKFASIMWKNRSDKQAYDYLHYKLDPKRRPSLTVTEFINGAKEIGCVDNTLRYICHELGYEMPERIESESGKIAEKEMIDLDEDIANLHRNLFEKLHRKEVLKNKIKRVTGSD